MLGNNAAYWFIYIFVVFVIVYLVMSYNTYNHTDVYIMGTAVAFLAAYAFYKVYYKNAVESFADAPLPTEKVVVEDYSAIANTHNVYLSVFTKDSLDVGTNEWVNVAYKEGETACKTLQNKVFEFENTPIFEKASGVHFGKNRLIGPLTNQLGISLQNTFTIFTCIKHGEFVSTNNEEIELLKLYANSGNNNGIALFIRANSIEVVDNVQRGELVLRYLDDNKSYECLLNANDRKFVLDKNVPTFFFIIKEVDTLRVVYMQGGSEKLYTIADIVTKDNNVTFSNKEMVINRFGNWKGSMYSFGVIPKAFVDSEISVIYKHIYGEYTKATNNNLIELTNDYNALVSALKQKTMCPYNSTVEAACPTITDWSNTNAVLNAPRDCREAINAFCTANPKDELCACWDKSLPSYNEKTCEMYRSIFDTTSKTFLETISTDDLNAIKSKFNLMNTDSCTTTKALSKEALQSMELKKNTYMDIDMDSVKISSFPSVYSNILSKDYLRPSITQTEEESTATSGASEAGVTFEAMDPLDSENKITT